MVITSRNEINGIPFHSAQFRYSLLYVLITFVVLLFLNIYCAKACQNLFYNNKKTAMLEICHIAAGSIADLEVINEDTIQASVSDLTDYQKTRLIVTDPSAMTLYDTHDQITYKETHLLFPEVITALEGNKVFRWIYHDGAMHSYAAMPIVSYGTLVGCVYMTEYDVEQGRLISLLQSNILTITLFLEIAVILFSLFFSNVYVRRLKKIMSSIRTVRDGDYSHKLDLTGHDELNILSNEFNDLISRLQTSENKRNRFVSDASHELKTPLASIKLLSDSILQNNMDAETVKEFVGDIGNEAERLNRMSQKLLTLSKTDATQQIDAEITYLTPTIERVVRMLAPSAQKSNVTVHVDIREDSPILILEDDLYQVIFNLVENGIKYNKKNGELHIILFRHCDSATIEIRDTGMGIPEDALNHIFERFYRVDKARSRSTGGSGLGLSIVRNIVKRNHGQIKVESGIGTGTSFTLQFPVFDTEEDSQ